METLEIPKKPEKTRKYVCKNCDFFTSHKNDYKRHIATLKHKVSVDGNDMETFYATKNPKKPKKTHLGYSCEICNKVYKTKSGMWKHHKICINEGNNCQLIIKNDNITDIQKVENLFMNNENKNDIIMTLLNQNNKLQEQIIELCKEKNTTQINTVNSHNKTFNLQVFLNETCKNAMNITDFIESLQIQLSDLESVGRLGFVDGISNIIVKNLRALDETQRPIHCTDKKRETVYVKDENKWEKEDEHKSRLRKAINYVANENTLLIPQWKAKHPDYLDSSSSYSDQYNNIVIEVLGGDDPSEVSEDKIIRKITREVFIDKK